MGAENARLGCETCPAKQHTATEPDPHMPSYVEGQGHDEDNRGCYVV